MESYYVYEIFLPLLATSFIAFPLTFSLIDLFTEKKGLNGLGLLCFLLFLIGRTLIPACPFSGLAAFLTYGTISLLPLQGLLFFPGRSRTQSRRSPILAGGVLLLSIGRIYLPYPYVLIVITAAGILPRLIIFEGKRNSTSWKNQDSWIIRSLRESIIILDREMNVISGTEDIFPTLRNTPGRAFSSLLQEAARHNSGLEPLVECLRGDGADRGIIRYGSKSYSYRLSIMDKDKGYLLTLLDITREQDLLAELKEKHRMLTNRRTILQSEEEGDISFHIKVEEIRERISREIQNLVEEELTILRNKLEKRDLSVYNITELQGYAENSMAHIREAVNELRGENYGNHYRSGGGSTTDKRLAQTPAVGRR